MARSVYARIQDLRALSVFSDDQAFTDLRLRNILEFSSRRIEQLTNQWFGPRRLDLLRSGMGRRQVEEPNSNKIIELERLALVSPSSGAETNIENRFLAVMDRMVRLRWTFGESEHFLFHGDFNPLRSGDRAFMDMKRRRFPDNDNNVRLIGVFGWIDQTEKVETTLASDLSRNGTLVTLADASAIEDGDLLMIGDGDVTFWVIANADGIVPANTVAIDPSPKKATAGVRVVRYGQVEFMIRDATLRTAVANRFMPGSDEELELQNSRRVRREETDNYEIEFFAAPSGSKIPSGTGDPIADSVLSDFKRPYINLRHV